MADERRDDWRHGVDENLASLNSGQRSQDEKLAKLDAAQDEQDSLLHGDTDSGLIGRIEDVEAEVRRLNAVVFMDALGNKGLHHDIKALLDRREDRRTGWGNITKIIVAVITSGAVGLFWQDIRTFVLKRTTDPVDQAIDRAKHPKGKHRHVIIRELPEETTED
jgi:hypothetical protein